MSQYKPSREVQGIISRHRSREGYRKVSTALKVPVNAVASIIHKLKKLELTRTLPGADSPTNLTATYTTYHARMAEWPDRVVTSQ